MAILTIVGLYPPIVVIGALVTAATGLPVALGTLVTVTIVAAIAPYKSLWNHYSAWLAEC